VKHFYLGVGMITGRSGVRRKEEEQERDFHFWTKMIE